MADKFTIALPYSGNRYYVTMPTSGLQSKVDFKMWGGGGGAGGADSHGGGNGAGGGFVAGTMSVAPGSLLEVYVGQGGTGGRSGVSGWGGGAGGYTLAAYAGGTGGNSGGAGSSGAGGGGGGASVLKIANNVVAVAGGGGAGGGGGNRGPYPYGESASGAMVPGTNSQAYPDGGGNGAWSWLLNTYSVWQGNGNYTWSVYFPTTQQYQFDLAIDNYGWLYVDDVEMVYAPSYNSVWSATQTITAGWHTVRIYGINTGGPGAIGARILQNGTAIWTTRSPISPGNSTHGFNGGNCGGDGGGGGAGGGGYYGGANYGPRPYYDNGGYAGANGANFVQATGNNPADTGSYGNGVNAGGAGDADYPSGVGHGGYANGGNGGNGYVILTFYKAAGFYVNDQGTYRRVVPKIKIAGTYSNNAIAWVKVDGVWRQVIAESSVSFSNDSTGWGG